MRILADHHPRYSFGEDPAETVITNYAWYGPNAGSATHEVGEKQPNPWGLHDIHGNVFEWCEDYYGVYPNGQRLVHNKYHVYRGGSWYCSAHYLRSASRHAGAILRSPVIGFRLLLGPAPDTVLPPMDMVPLQPLLSWADNGTSVQVSATTLAEGAIIRYNTNGVEPDAYSAPATPVLLRDPATVKLIAFKNGFNQSPTLTVVIAQLPPPEIMVSEGWLELAPTHPDATMEYAVARGEWLPYTGPTALTGHGTIQVRARLPDCLTSVIEEAAF